MRLDKLQNIANRITEQEGINRIEIYYHPDLEKKENAFGIFHFYSSGRTLIKSSISLGRFGKNRRILFHELAHYIIVAKLKQYDERHGNIFYDLLDDLKEKYAGLYRKVN